MEWAGGTAPRRETHVLSAAGRWRRLGGEVRVAVASDAQPALPRARSRGTLPLRAEAWLSARMRLSFSPLLPSPPPQVKKSRSRRVPRDSF